MRAPKYAFVLLTLLAITSVSAYADAIVVKHSLSHKTTSRKSYHPVPRPITEEELHSADVKVYPLADMEGSVQAMPLEPYVNRSVAANGVSMDTLFTREYRVWARSETQRACSGIVVERNQVDTLVDCLKAYAASRSAVARF